MSDTTSGATKLINSIVGEAKADAEAMLQNAEHEASAILAKADSEAREILARAEQSASIYENDVLLRNRTNAELDAKKYALREKRSLMERAYAAALKKLYELGEADTKKILSAILSREAEGGELVVASSLHKRSVGDIIFDVNAVLRRRGVEGVTLSEKVCGLKSGFMLVGSGFQKNCSFEDLISDMRETEDGYVANTLFS